MLFFNRMAYTGAFMGGEESPQMGGVKQANTAKVPTLSGKSKLFVTKNPGSPGKLGRSSTLSESLSKLRGKGAMA